MTSTHTPVRDVEEAHGQADEYIHYDHIGHGSTPAAWSLSIGVMIGSLLIGVGMILELMILIWIGIGLLPIAIAMGIILKRMGYGVEIDSDSVLKRGADPRDHAGPGMDNVGREDSGAPRRSAS